MPVRGRFFIRPGCLEHATVLRCVGVLSWVHALLAVFAAITIVVVRENEDHLDALAQPYVSGNATTITWGDLTWAPDCVGACAADRIAAARDGLAVASTWGLAALLLYAAGAVAFGFMARSAANDGASSWGRRVYYLLGARAFLALLCLELFPFLFYAYLALVARSHHDTCLDADDAPLPRYATVAEFEPKGEFERKGRAAASGPRGADWDLSV